MCNNNSETIEYKTIRDISHEFRTPADGFSNNVIYITSEVNNYELNWFGEFTSDKYIYIHLMELLSKLINKIIKNYILCYLRI